MCWVFSLFFLIFCFVTFCFTVSLNLSVSSSNLYYSGIYLAIFFHLMHFSLFLYSLLSDSSLLLLAFHINHPLPAYTFVNSCQDPAVLNTQPSTHPPPTINLASSHLFPTRAHPCAHPHTHVQTQGFLGSRDAIPVYCYKTIYLPHIDSP